MTSLFERIGGDAAVRAAVDRFYEIVLNDDRISRFFAGVDMNRLATHQKIFLKYAFGGLPNYPSTAMRAAHNELVHEKGLNDSHFDAVLEDLAQALKDLGVGDEMIGEVITIAETTRDDVLDRDAERASVGASGA